MNVLIPRRILPAPCGRKAWHSSFARDGDSSPRAMRLISELGTTSSSLDIEGTLRHAIRLAGIHSRMTWQGCPPASGPGLRPHTPNQPLREHVGPALTGPVGPIRGFYAAPSVGAGRMAASHL